MRRITSVLAAAVAFVTVMTGPAHATPCPLVTDPTGDGGWPIAAPLLTPPALDVVGADVASGATTVVAVVRLASLAADPADALGMTWRFGWTIAGTHHMVEARRSNTTGAYVASFQVAGVPAPSTFAADVATATLTWTMPRSSLPALATPGATFQTFSGNSNLFGSTADVFFDGAATYVDQDPGCVPAA